MREAKDAIDELTEFLDPEESVEAVVFGYYGGDDWHDEVDTVPRELIGKVLSFEQAKQYMRGWSFYGGFGFPDSYPVYIWTNKHVIFVHEYDGATGLRRHPRNPVESEPSF